jgi:hypothetical protein
MAEKPMPVEVTNTVHVTGNVNVVNTPGNPVPVNVMKTPREIFRYTNNFTSSSNNDSFTVEGPKRLVIEFASVNFAVASPSESPEDSGIQVVLNIAGFQYIIPNTSAGRGVFGAYLRLGAQPVKIYVEPGESVSIVCNYSGPGEFGGKLGLSGYYEEVPSP